MFGWLTALAGFGSFAVAGFVPDRMIALPIIAGAVLSVGGLIGGMLGSRILIPKRINKHFIWLGKVSPEYLATFPDSSV